MQDKEKIFEQLFHSHYTAMYRLAFSLLHDSEESKDVVSDVFAKLWDSRSPVKADTQRAFLLTCVRNRCLNIIAKKSLNEKLHRLYPLEHTAATMPTDDDEHRLQEVLHVIDNDLTPQASRILHLRYGEGKSYRETARVLGISTSTVNKHIVQALKMLRTRFLKEKRNAPGNQFHE